MLQAGLMQEAIDTIRDNVVGWFEWIPDWFFLSEWVLLGLGLLALCGAIVFFFGRMPVIGPWLSGISGFVVFCYGFFLAGIVVAYNHFKTERTEDKQTIRDLKKQNRSGKNGSW